MSSPQEITAAHPLFKELRNGLLWHRTSPADYRRIRIDQAIKPNDGRINRWNQIYACQQLGGISMFDFTTAPEEDVLWQSFKWQQFLGDFDPVTILLGMDRAKLPGKLVPYPQNKEGTTGNVIPWVEVCHCGQIPLSTVISYLLVCPVDYCRFKTFAVLDEMILTSAEQEFWPIVKAQRDRSDALYAKQMSSLRQQLANGNHRPK